MSHITTVWARFYGLPDPSMAADEVLAAQPTVLDRLSTAVGSAGTRFDAAYRSCHRGTAHVRHGWSNDTAVDRSAALAGACQGLAARMDDVGRALEYYGQAAHAAHRTILEAHGQVERAIAADSRLTDLVSMALAGGDDGLAAERATLTAIVYRAACRAHDDLCDAAGTLLGHVGDDPGQLVPRSIPAASAVRLAAFAGRWRDRRHRQELERDLDSGIPQRHEFARSVKAALDRASADGTPVELLAYRAGVFDGQGAAAIAVGDVARADMVGVLVPGVANSPSDMSGSLAAAARLSAATEAAAGPGARSATVVWMGYDIPMSASKDPDAGSWLAGVGRTVSDFTSAIDDDVARTGGALLARFCTSLHTQMDPAASLTVYGHSYGATVVSDAATVMGPDAGVDDIVLMAAPGAGEAESVKDYRAVTKDHVYTLAYPADPVPSALVDGVAGAGQVLVQSPAESIEELFTGDLFSPYGPDPNDDDFDAQRLDAPSNVPVDHGGPSLPMSFLPGGQTLAHAGLDPINNLNQHDLDNYLSGAALAGIASITAGRYSRVPVKRRRR